MSWIPNETEIVDYLYGELAPDKLKDFEEYMQQNPDFEREVQTLKQTQKLLPSLADEQVVQPKPFILESRKRSTLHGSRKWLLPLSIAASLAAIMLAGYFAQFSMTIGEDGLRVAFYNEQPIPEAAITKDEVQALIDSSVRQVSDQWQNQASQLQVSFASQLAHNKRLTETEIKRVAAMKPQAEIDEDQILNFIAQLKDENKKMIQNFYRESAEDQQAKIRHVLVEYNEYLDKQRQEDLQFIQSNMLALRSTSELKQEETDKILASIITTVNNQNSFGE